MTHHLFFSTTFGESAVIYRESPFRIIEILLPCKNRKALLQSLDEAEWGLPGSHHSAQAVSKLVIKYFNGHNIHAPWKLLAMERLTELQQAVLMATAQIPYGQVRAYKDIARAIGRPRACRFVGTTLANNPFPILIPCHRVIRSDGSTGWFSGGTALAPLKQRMISLETANKK
jgi:methylated-DNA-[protein]-cysteine S-methyltransferase